MGGDDFDLEIKRNIRACSLFVPVISHTTQSRHEGYFRLESNLAIERSQLIAESIPFILPVAIDPVADLPAGMRTFVEDRLLTKSGFRNNLALETALEEPGVTRVLIDTLVSRRLLRVEDRAGVQRVELTHDVLAEVIRAARDERQQRLALEEAAARERQARAEAARHARQHRLIISGLAAAVVALLIGAFFGIRAQRPSSAAGVCSFTMEGRACPSELECPTAARL
jgi:hypothetical protein